MTERTVATDAVIEAILLAPKEVSTSRLAEEQGISLTKASKIRYRHERCALKVYDRLVREGRL